MLAQQTIDDVRQRINGFFVPRPPGPSTLETFRYFSSMSTTPVKFFQDAHQQWGDVVFHRLMHVPIYTFFHPDAIEQVLLKKRDSFIKDSLTRDLKHLLGRGLLTNEGEPWKKQRRLISPPLQRKHIALYADTMVDEAEKAVEDLRDGRVVNIGDKMMAMTLEIAGRTFFDSGVAGDASTVSHSMEVAMHHFQLSAQTWRQLLPEWIPQPGQKEFEQAVADVDEVLFRIIQERRHSDLEGDDLLSLLLRARDDDGVGMDDQQLRDEAITIFLAGHETTALALTWAIYLWCRVPEAADRVRAEVDEVLGERTATVDDVVKLPLTEAFIKETMRLYPPAWTIGREATEDVEIGGWKVPKGSQVLTPQCVVHRDERWFPQPDEFRLERWLDGNEKSLPRFGYFPFGGGPRICIGNHFAMMEAVLTLATLVQHRDFELVSPKIAGGPGDAPVSPSVTLRPAGEIEVKVAVR